MFLSRKYCQIEYLRHDHKKTDSQDGGLMHGRANSQGRDFWAQMSFRSYILQAFQQYLV